MVNRFLFAAFEAWAVTRLLRSELFHRAVRHTYRRINGMPPPAEELGGSKVPAERRGRFFKLFLDEVKEQAGWKGKDASGGPGGRSR